LPRLGQDRPAVRVLVLTNMFPPHAYGGYELWCRDVVRRWRRSGHDVEILTSDVAFPDVTEAEEPGLAVRRELRLYWADHVVLDPAAWRRPGLERHNQRALDRTLAEFRPDVVSAWAMGAMSLGLLTRVADLGVPTVAVVCDEWPVYGPVMDGWSRALTRRPFLARVLRGLTGLPCRLPDLDAVPTLFMSEALRQRAATSSPWTFPLGAVVPGGVDRAEFPARPESGTGDFAWRLLHVGRVDPRKGLHTVITALAGCPPEATLELLGGGDDAYRRSLVALASELGVAERVTFGLCARYELAERYGAADALVFAPEWDEPFGLVPLEAMSCGTPVVASPTGGSAEFLHDGDNCVAFTPGDAAGLTAALRRLAADDALRRRLVAGGLATAARFDSDRVAGEIERHHVAAASGEAG